MNKEIMLSDVASSLWLEPLIRPLATFSPVGEKAGMRGRSANQGSTE